MAEAPSSPGPRPGPASRSHGLTLGIQPCSGGWPGPGAGARAGRGRRTGPRGPLLQSMVGHPHILQL